MTSTAVGRDPVPLSAAYREITVAVLAMVTIVAFEAMSVSTAMPDVARELRAVRGYGLAFSVMLTAQLLGIVLAGVWSDRSGPLPGTFAGQGLVAVGSAICGLATSYPIFLVGRVVTGLGGGLLVVMLYVIAARVYPESVRPRLFSLMSAAWVLPSLVGPSIAAWLTQTFSWRWVFLVVVPPVVVAVAFFARTRRRLGDETTTGEVSHRDAGAHRRAAWSGLGLALAAGAVQWGTAGTEHGLGWPAVLSAAGVLGVVLTAPRLVPAGTWLMRRGIPSVMLSRALLSAAFGAGIAYVPLLVVTEYHQTLLVAGGLVAAGSLGWATGAWWQGHTRTTVSRDRFVLAGAALLMTGMAGIAGITLLHLPWPTLALPMVLLGLAMGVGTTTTTLLALGMVTEGEHGETSSAIQLADVLGGVLGIAAATAAFSTWHVEGGDRLLFALLFLAIGALSSLVLVAAQRIRT